MYAKHCCNFCNVCVKNFCLALTLCGLGLQTVMWENCRQEPKEIAFRMCGPYICGVVSGRTVLNLVHETEQ